MESRLLRRSRVAGPDTTQDTALDATPDTTIEFGET